MKLRSSIVILLTVFLFVSCSNNSANQNLKVELKDAGKQVDVIIDGKPFTSLCWYDNVYKPILYPVYTAAGTEITRGFPLRPREGESTDHRHQVGIWLNYGNVNGFDFWGNGS